MRSGAPLALRSDSEVTSHGLERRQQKSYSFANDDLFYEQSTGQVAQITRHLCLGEVVFPGQCIDCALSIAPKLFPRATVWLRALKGSGP